MKRLAFAAASIVDGRRLREARFDERSLLPVSAACLVANAVRETLGALFAISLDARLYAPLVPSRDGWRRICDGARWFGVRGSSGEAALVVGADAALALAAAAFGEREPAARPPSSLEREVLSRIATALAGTLAALTGTVEGGVRETEPEPAGLRTYFEIGLAGPVAARIGIASLEPRGLPIGPVITRDDLATVQIELSARLLPRAIGLIRLGDLREGAYLPITSLAAELRAGALPIAGGCAGARNGYYAVRCEDRPPTTKGTI